MQGHYLDDDDNDFDKLYEELVVNRSSLKICGKNNRLKSPKKKKGHHGNLSSLTSPLDDRNDIDTCVSKDTVVPVVKTAVSVQKDQCAVLGTDKTKCVSQDYSSSVYDNNESGTIKDHLTPSWSTTGTAPLKKLKQRKLTSTVAPVGIQTEQSLDESRSRTPRQVGANTERGYDSDRSDGSGFCQRSNISRISDEKSKRKKNKEKKSGKKPRKSVEVNSNQISADVCIGLSSVSSNDKVLQWNTMTHRELVIPSCIPPGAMVNHHVPHSDVSDAKCPKVVIHEKTQSPTGAKSGKKSRLSLSKKRERAEDGKITGKHLSICDSTSKSSESKCHLTVKCSVDYNVTSPTGISLDKASSPRNQTSMKSPNWKIPIGDESSKLRPEKSLSSKSAQTPLRSPTWELPICEKSSISQTENESSVMCLLNSVDECQTEISLDALIVQNNSELCLQKKSPYYKLLTKHRTSKENSKSESLQTSGGSPKNSKSVSIPESVDSTKNSKSVSLPKSEDSTKNSKAVSLPKSEDSTKNSKSVSLPKSEDSTKNSKSVSLPKSEDSTKNTKSVSLPKTEGSPKNSKSVSTPESEDSTKNSKSVSLQRSRSPSKTSRSESSSKTGGSKKSSKTVSLPNSTKTKSLGCTTSSSNSLFSEEQRRPESAAERADNSSDSGIVCGQRRNGVGEPGTKMAGRKGDLEEGYESDCSVQSGVAVRTSHSVRSDCTASHKVGKNLRKTPLSEMNSKAATRKKASVKTQEPLSKQKVKKDRSTTTMDKCKRSVKHCSSSQNMKTPNKQKQHTQKKSTKSGPVKECKPKTPSKTAKVRLPMKRKLSDKHATHESKRVDRKSSTSKIETNSVITEDIVNVTKPEITTSIAGLDSLEQMNSLFRETNNSGRQTIASQGLSNLFLNRNHLGSIWQSIVTECCDR